MEREAILRHKIELAQQVHDNITTPGWINQRAPRAFRLRLDGDVMEMTKNFMGETMPSGKRSLGVKGIKKNLEAVIPGYKAELTYINEARHIHTATEVLNFIIEDSNFTVKQAMIMLVRTSPKQPVTPQTAFDDLTHTIDIFREEEKLDQQEAEVFEKISIFDDFKGDLKNWFENRISKQTQEVATTGKEAPSQLTLLSLVNRVIDLIPEQVARFWSGNNLLSLEQYEKQSGNFAIFAKDVSEGKISPVDNASILKASGKHKEELATNRLRQMLVPLVLNPDLSVDRFRNRWARNIRELLDWMGAGSREKLTQIIENLPELDRALVISNSSINLLEDLGYLDLEDCNEEIFATHIRNVAFDRDEVHRDRDFEYLLYTAVERSDAGNLDLSLVVESLCDSSYVGLIIAKMKESAKFGRFEDLLTLILLTHPATSHFAREIQGYSPDQNFDDESDDESDENFEDEEPFSFRRIENQSERQRFNFRRQ